jgi:hypothetical protein
MLAQSELTPSELVLLNGKQFAAFADFNESAPAPVYQFELLHLSFFRAWDSRAQSAGGCYCGPSYEFLQAITIARSPRRELH